MPTSTATYPANPCFFSPWNTPSQSTVPRPAATMFVWARIPDAFAAEGAQAFAVRLLREAHVAVSPGSGFGADGEGYVRFALVENEQRIAQAVRGLRAVLA